MKSKSFLSKVFLVLLIELFFSGTSSAEGPFKDPPVEGRLSAVYRVQANEDESLYFQYITRVKMQVYGEDFHVKYLREDNGVEIEMVSALNSLKPIYTVRFDKEELIYKIHYYDDYADVFIPKEKAEKSQSGIPPLFRKILGIGKKDEEDDSGYLLTPEELEEMEKKRDVVLPSEKILKRVRDYTEKNKIVPFEVADTERRIELPEDVYALQSLNMALEGFPFKEKKKVTFNLSFLPRPMMILKMKVTCLDEEDVTVPAGTFRCYKLEMETNEWWSFLVFGTDDTYFWIQKDYPNIFVKYTYPFVGRFTELVSYQIDSGENFE